MQKTSSSPSLHKRCDDFLAAPAGFAVVGASSNRSKYGNKVLRCFYQHGKDVVPVSTKEAEIEGLRCVASLQELRSLVGVDVGVVFVTPPAATLQLLAEAKSLGIQRLWLQPGAESPEVLAKAVELDLSMVHSGPCLLNTMGFNKHWEPPKVLSCGEHADGSVRWRIDDGFVMTITLSNARRRNPLSHSVLEALHTLLSRAAGVADEVRVIILEAEGPVFSSGHDFSEFLAERGSAAHAATLSLCTAVNLKLQTLAQPTIAAVGGLATAAGCQLASSCDLVVASSAAAFQLPGAKDGGFCHTPAVAVAARTASPRQALELALLAEPVPASRAEMMGLVNRVVAPADLKGEARRMADRIARVSPPRNMQLGKKTFYMQVAKATLEEKYAIAEPVMLGMFRDPVYQKVMADFLAAGRGPKT